MNGTNVHGESYYETKEIEAFVGVSDGHEGMDEAIKRAAELASKKGKAGTVYHLQLEIEVGPGQWVKANRAILTPEG